MATKKFNRLTLSERVIIETLLGEKRTQSYIAKKLNRARTTISREINTWKGSSTYYSAVVANEHARLLNKYKRIDHKISIYPALRIQVYRGLLSELSPEAISGRLKLQYPNDPHMNISYESIYRFIYEHPQNSFNRKLIKLLPRKKRKRWRKVKKDRHGEKIKNGISIENRPTEVEDREEVGHWEGDLMIGIKQNSCIGSIVERKSRYTILVKLANKKSKNVCHAFAEKLSILPKEYRKSMTYDNGVEMAQHQIITDKTGMNIYFAHPYSSWERGTNENTNGIVRRFLPKKTTDFNKVDSMSVQNLQDRLNNRPRKVLCYYTPNEIYQYELNKLKSYNDNDVGLEMGNKSPKDLFSFLMPKLE